MKPNSAFEIAAHWIAGVGPLLFFAVATVEGAVRGGYDPIAEPISALAIGPRGWIQQLNFAVLAASFLSFAFVLRAQLRGGAASIAAPAVLLLMTTGVVLAGAFTMDGSDATPTLAGRLHMMAGFLVFPWMPVALFAAARAFHRDARWRSWFAYTLATALLSVATIAFFLLFVGPPPAPRPLSEWAGLVQRVQLVPFFAWMALVARHAYAGAAPRRQSAATSTSTSRSVFSDQLSSDPRS